jgi:hypothetical protein
MMSDAGVSNVRYRGWWLACAMVWGLVGCAEPTGSADESYAIKFNVYCTTCDDFLQCRPEADPSVASDNYTLYRLQGKSAWGQIATIWDYLIARIRPKTSDNRPLAIYEDFNGQKRLRIEGAEARVDLKTAMIALPDSRIDMRDGHWYSVEGGVLGHCAAMTRREGYAFVRALLGKASL